MWARSCQRVVGGGVVRDHGGRLDGGDARRQREQPLGAHRDLLGQATPAGRRRDAVAHRHRCHAFTDAGHDAGDLAARRVRELRLDLVAAAGLEDVGEVQSDGLDVDDDLARHAPGRVALLEHHHVGWLAQLVHPPHLHGVLLRPGRRASISS